MPECSERDIEAWQHEAWEEIVGNRRFKSFLQSMVRSIVGPSRGRGINTLVRGPARSGKTSTVEFAIKAMTCWGLDVEHLRPCGRCQPCVQHQGRFELLELDQVLWGGPNADLCFVPINGNSITQSALEDQVAKAAGSTHLRWIYYIDEIQGLVRRHIDHTLMQTVEQQKSITWIVTTATTAGLEPMFRKRFTEVATELSKPEEFLLFLAKRCMDPRVAIRWDDETTLLELARRSALSPGLALKCLAQAKMFGGILTKSMVEEYPFTLVDS